MYNSLNTDLSKNGVWQRNLSVDESMVPYFGRNSLKMFIRGKPIRFGYKFWALCGSDGYLYSVKIYTGRETVTEKQPLGTRVVNSMVDIVEEHSDLSAHSLYFDNFFTSYQLMHDLKKRGMKATEKRYEGRADRHLVI